MRPRRIGAAALSVAALSVVLAGCGDDADDDSALGRSSTTSEAPSSSTTSTTAATSTTRPQPDLSGLEGELPPQPALALEPLYGEGLAALGLRLTERGGLIDRSDGYEPSASGTHLALYVEPIADRTPEQYVEGIGTVAVLFSDVFDRWPGLESFDVCQEPPNTEDASNEPLPITQIDVSRAQFAAFDWPAVAAVDLVRASLADPPGITLRVSPGLAEHPAYQAVLDQAAAP